MKKILLITLYLSIGLSQRNKINEIISERHQNGLKKLVLVFEGTGINEIGYWENQEIIKVDPRYFRATEVETLLGDASKAKKTLGWEPKITFEKLVEEMTLSDLKIAQKNELINKHGYQVKNYFE